ncbi:MULTISPECIES: FMN-binding protein [unclassified Lentimicrobium]|uniref:FMN-binding protein n=1 Tax=unclassified Lentimicrobium TaxID=2677434 RepID=UPI00155494CF|nr:MULTISPECIES: FMN-binding protein [unclassified Lentimicrobium]NPD43999.1 FMN-binding protein [Lentimicrobium sp. S6]NPD84087.1 FMN-binding protein [Lentimicrobium sp. L6]
MIYKIFIFIIMLTPITEIFRSGVGFNHGIEKRINRNLVKYFEKESFNKKTIAVHDSILTKTNSYFYQVENTLKTRGGYMVITIANGCKVGGCDVEHEVDEEFEQFWVYSFYSSEAELLDLKILDYQSEHGYEITSKWWLKQFVKHQKETYRYGKNIDGISGATISIKSMIREMNYLEQIMPAVILLSAK